MVVPPFGFGVGDFLAVAKLTGKIASELKDVSVFTLALLHCTADLHSNRMAKLPPNTKT